MESRVGAFHGGHFLRCPASDKFSTLVPSLRADVDNPVGTLDHVQIVFDHDDAISFRDKTVEGFQKNCDIVDMKTGCRLVKDEESSPRLVSRQACRKLESLGFTATQDIERLTEF